MQLGKTGTHLSHSSSFQVVQQRQKHSHVHLTAHPAGIKVHSLAIGAWQWGDISFWGYDTYGGYGEDEIRFVPGLLLQSPLVLYACKLLFAV